MKHCICFLICSFLTYSITGQKVKSEKIDREYFQKISKYDNLDFYIISDNAKILFDYSDRYLGAIDKNFDADLKRTLRFKVNSLDKLSDNKLIVFKLRDSISYENIDFDKIKIYTLNKGKVTKKAIKPKSVFIFQDNYSYIFDLKKVGVTPGSIIEISYSLKDQEKQILSWRFQHKYFTLFSSFETWIPEIYSYDMEKIGVDELKIDHKSLSTKGVLIGYHMPNEPLKYKLVTPTYYKLVKKKGKDVSSAKKVFCTYTINQFSVSQMYPTETQSPSAHILFKLREVGSILF